MTKLFEKNTSEMQAKEIRDELAVMLKELRAIYWSRNLYWNDDFIRQNNKVPIKYKNGIDTLQFMYGESDAWITIAAIKDIQALHGLKDTDSICMSSGKDYDGYIETVLTFMTEVKETDLEYYQRIKELYLQQKQVDKVHKFIYDIKKRTGVDTPYYAAKAAMEIFEAYKKEGLV